MPTFAPLTQSNTITPAFDDIPVAIYTCDKMGYVTSFNTTAVKLWGRTPEIGKDRWSGAWKTYKINGEPLPLDECPMALALKKGIAIKGEEIVVERPDGTKLYVQPNPVPVYDDERHLTGAINTLIDITEQKIGESRQAMLAAIIESSEDAIISKTLAGVITTWNDAAQRMYGYTAREAIGQNITMIIPLDRIDEETLIINKIKSGELVEHFETWRVSKDGKLIPVSLTISPIKNKNGTIIGASKIARDITRYKEAEDQIQHYVENLEVLNAAGKSVSESLNIDEILQKATDATTQLTGAAFGAFFYNKVDEQGESYMLFTLSGAPREAFEKFGMPRNTAIFHPTFVGEGIVRSDDITKDPRYGKTPPHYGQPKGHLPVVSYLAVPVISKSGDVIGGLFFGHPEAGKFTYEHEQLVTWVVNQTAVALENAKLYEEIQKLNSKKDEFIGMASHELKTPVTSLKGYLQVFERNLGENDQNKRFINKAVQQVNKLSALISDLLDVSKIETGKLPLDFTRFSIKQQIKEVIDLLQYGSKSHHLTFSTNEDEVMVIADKQRIEQVIINLISNAIKYSPEGKAVNVFLKKSADKAIVSVQDFGMGISKDQQERIFSRFYRVDELATHISGLGIGLYISKEIISRHNGKVSVESEPNKGSTFIFEIPLERA